MRRALAVLTGLSLAACAARPSQGAQSANQEPLDTTTSVVVPPAEPSAEPAPATPERSTELLASGDGIDSCIADLRAADGVETGSAERALYDEARQAEARGELAKARRAYFELIKTAPRSRLVPLTYLAFGEIFRSEARADPAKWSLAEKLYLEVLKYPPADNRAYALAMLRLGEVGIAHGDDAQALSHLVKAAQATEHASSAPCSAEIREALRSPLIKAYASAGRPDRARAFFARSFGDAEVATLLVALADEYLHSDKITDACTVGRAAKSASADTPTRKRIAALLASRCRP